jgi:sialic acid synthase SpsE
MRMILEIDGVKIGAGNPPYVIAEISANHNGQLKNALKLIDMASRCGANAVKLQSYTPDTITLDCDHDDFIIRGGLWDG